MIIMRKGNQRAFIPFRLRRDRADTNMVCFKNRHSGKLLTFLAPLKNKKPDSYKAAGNGQSLNIL
jgi:hypothetical protein